MSYKYVLEVKNLTKSFGAVRAVTEVSFTVGKREIIGLVGDNGAGKTTIINLIMGVFPPDKGEILFEGKKVRFNSPRDSRRAGIEPVYQNTAVVDLMNLWRNFYIGREITKSFGPISILNRKKMMHDSLEVMQEIGVNVREADGGVGVLSGGERQSLCIGRCMKFGGKLLLLDEPTAALSVKETQKVLKFAESVRKKGISEIIVDHNIHHIYPIVDRFIIMGRGKKITELKKNEFTPEDIIKIIVES